MNEWENISPALSTCKRNVDPSGRYRTKKRKKRTVKAGSLLTPVTLPPSEWEFQTGVGDLGWNPIYRWHASPMKSGESRCGLMGWWEFTGAVPGVAHGSINVGRSGVGRHLEYWWGSVWKVHWAPWKKCSVAILGFCLDCTLIPVQLWKMILLQTKRLQWN